MRPCFAFSAATATKPAVLALDEEIGMWGTQAKDFRAALDSITGNELEIQINSPGGDVMAGLGMYNMLRNWAAAGKTITTRITGVAASIASIIMLAGDKREMPSNAFAMVHSVESGVWGTEEQIRDHADTVGKIQSSLRNIYIDRMGVDEAKAREIMAKDTWLTADECLEMGVVTNVVDPINATAKFDLARAALPANVAKVFQAKVEDLPAAPAPVTKTPEPVPASESTIADAIAAEATAAGLGEFAAYFGLSSDSIESARAKLVVARETVALCALAGRPGDAKKFIVENKSAAEVREALLATLADTDEHIDGAPKTKPTTGDSAQPTAVEPTALWAAHKKANVKKGR